MNLSQHNKTTMQLLPLCLQFRNYSKTYSNTDFKSLFLDCIALIRFQVVTAELCQCISQCALPTETVPPPPVAATCDLSLVVRLSLQLTGPLCFKYRIARTPPLSVFAGYWKRPLAGKMRPTGHLGIARVCCSKWPYHISVYILINNHVNSKCVTLNKIFSFK